MTWCDDVAETQLLAEIGPIRCRPASKVRSQDEAEVGPQAKPANSAENDPYATLAHPAWGVTHGLHIGSM